MKALKNRRKILKILNRSGETDDKEEVVRRPRTIAIASEVPRTPDIPANIGTLATQGSEADSDFPSIVPGLKGIRIDTRITILRIGGGVANYNTWLSNLRDTFGGDLNRFIIASNRILFAIAYLD